jgi:1,4-alpha-glucan branching enzyme
VDVADKQNSVVSYVRRDGDDHRLVVLNLTPVPREHYRIGVPGTGAYRLVLSSDDPAFGGSGLPARAEVPADAAPFHGHAQSVELTLPPLAALVYAPAPVPAAASADAHAEADAAAGAAAPGDDAPGAAPARPQAA